MNGEPYLSQLTKKKPIIAVHRGSSTGNIAENTIESTLCAIKLGADIVELDIAKSKDNVFYGFHTGMELRLLGQKINIESLTSNEIESLNFINTNMKPSGYKVNKIEDILTKFRGKVMFNLDRAWLYLDTLLPFLDRLDMYDQLIIKSPPENQYLDLFAKYNDKIAYMPIVRNKEQLDLVLSHAIAPVSIEIIFKSLDSPLIKKETIETIKQHNMLLWGNAIIVGPEHVIAGPYTDDISITKGYSEGWGKLIEIGFDIIQTDWPSLLKEYREEVN